MHHLLHRESEEFQKTAGECNARLGEAEMIAGLSSGESLRSWGYLPTERPVQNSIAHFPRPFLPPRLRGKWRAKRDEGGHGRACAALDAGWPPAGERTRPLVS